MKKVFKKIFICLVGILAIGTLLACDDNNSNENQSETPPVEEIPTNDPVVDEPTIEDVYTDDGFIAKGEGLENAIVVFHYKRKKADYKNWCMWVWNNNGIRLHATNQDSFGVYYKIDLSDETKDYYHAKRLGYIYHYSVNDSWGSKDIDKDRFVDLNESMLDEKNEIHLYNFEGEENIYLDRKKEKPVCTIESFGLGSDTNVFKVELNTKAVSYELFKDGELIKNAEVDSKSFIVLLPNGFKYSLGDDYKIKVNFGNDTILESTLNYSSYYDMKHFSDNFVYTGNDLGVTLANNNTTFKVWAPGAKKMSVQIFNYGHTTELGTSEYPGDDTPVLDLEMTKGEYGVWSVTVNEDLSDKYYTYTVTHGNQTISNVVDPYALGTGLNGLRGYIANFDEINESINWNPNYTRPYTANQLVVYELHVRDLTMDSTWTGNAQRGTYLAMAESGTTYTQNNVTVTTGFDHIKELGVNAVQILPYYDQYNDETSDIFNWGYNPQNYNSLEGQYSSNPYDGKTRIVEFKQMVQAYQEAGIEIIMDVVYNHMNSIGGSSFDMLVPGYYFRYNTDGTPSNGSGCGNETASERAMFSKFMIDSTTFWASEYNLSGFRFDLMGLHDYKTMNAIAAKLHEIDPNIVVYGEPWTGGTSTLATSNQSTTTNVSKLVNVAIFNDSIRDAIKGSVFDTNVGGWVQNGSNVANVKGSLRGLWKSDPKQQINYVSCHDNNTIADKLTLTGVSNENLSDASVLANGLVLTAEGISFLHAGAEILRSKKIYDENGEWTGEYSHNSYNLSDEVNAINWDEKIDNIETFEQYKALIKINREHAIYQLSTKEQCANYQVLEANNKYVMAQITTPSDVTDTWSAATMIYANAKATGSSIELTGEWTVAFASGNTTLKVNDKVTGTISFDEYTMIILYQN